HRRRARGDARRRTGTPPPHRARRRHRPGHRPGLRNRGTPGAGEARGAGNTGERRTMSGLPPCPACGSDLTYEDGAMLVCPECAHEWAPGDATGGGETRVHRDAVGNILADGDSVTV